MFQFKLYQYLALPKLSYREHKSSMVYRNESIVLCPILPWGQFWLVMAQVNKLETNVFMVPSYLTVQCEIIRPGKKGRNTKKMLGQIFILYCRLLGQFLTLSKILE